VTPLETAIRVVIDLLIRGEYGVIEKMTQGRRLSAAELEDAVTSYGRRLVGPPDGWLNLVDVVPIDEGELSSFFAAVPLWTEEEGRSDLTVELRLTEIAQQVYDTEVLDLHVL
jgi:hypothetical protein